MSKLLKDESLEAHLVGKNEEEVSRLAGETGFEYSVADVLEENFLEKFNKILVELIFLELPIVLDQ